MTRRPLTQHQRHGAQLNIAKLPERCFAIHPGDGRDVVIIERGKQGYFPYKRVATFEIAEKVVADFNKTLGASPRATQAMLAGSMHGWHIPAADPDCLAWSTYPEKY